MTDRPEPQKPADGETTASPQTENRPRKGPRTGKKIAVTAQPLSTSDGTADPLGPLGQVVPNALDEEPPPLPPAKESPPPKVDTRQTLSRGVETPEKPRTAQASVSIEQAARPSFHITVGDPHKVGDLTSSHTEYQIRTKVVVSLKKHGSSRIDDV